jgi:hypothetical protein
MQDPVISPGVPHRVSNVFLAERLRDDGASL